MNPMFISKMRVATAAFRMMPDFVIPGEAKCGTTSLYRYLCRHPWVVSADMKEPESFIHYGASPMFCAAHYPFLWKKWIGAIVGKRLVAGEASADYYSHPAAPEALAQTLPNAKIIILLRNPVNRAFSDYRMFKTAGIETGSFEPGVEGCLRWISDPALEPLVQMARLSDKGFLRYILRGLYAENLRRWQKLFPSGQLLILKSENLFNDPQAVLDRIFAFLGLPTFKLESFEILKKGGYAEQMNDRTRSMLEAYYRPHNQEFYQLLGEDFGWEE